MQNNSLYNVTTDFNNINENIKTLENYASTNNNTSAEKETPNEDQHNIEEIEDPLITHPQATNETCLQSVLPDYPVTLQQSGSLGNEIYDIISW